MIHSYLVGRKCYASDRMAFIAYSAISRQTPCWIIAQNLSESINTRDRATRLHGVN